MRGRLSTPAYDLCTDRIARMYPCCVPGLVSLDNDAMNGRVAGLVSRYWHRQGYTVEVGTKEGPVWSNLSYGLPPGYRGQDAMPISAVRP